MATLYEESRHIEMMYLFDEANNLFNFGSTCCEVQVSFLSFADI